MKIEQDPKKGAEVDHKRSGYQKISLYIDTKITESTSTSQLQQLLDKIQPDIKPDTLHLQLVS